MRDVAGWSAELLIGRDDAATDVSYQTISTFLWGSRTLRLMHLNVFKGLQ